MHHWRLALKFSNFSIYKKTNDRIYLQNQVEKLCASPWVASNHRAILAAEIAQLFLSLFSFDLPIKKKRTNADPKSLWEKDEWLEIYDNQFGF